MNTSLNTRVSNRRRPGRAPAVRAESLEQRTLFAAGDLDTTFGTATTPGWVRTNMGHTYDEATSVAVQTDGKILAAGYAGRFGVARYLPNGTLDNTFGSGGRALVAQSGTPNAMALRSDGKIVLAGYDFNAPAGRWDLALVRLNPNGALDSTFGSGGRVYADFGSVDEATDIALQSDGRIVVSARISNDFGVARFNENGSLDTSFGDGGLVTTDLGSTNEQANAVLVQADGRIVVGGYTEAGSTDGQFALARYEPDGSPDLSFGPDGTGTAVFHVADQSFGGDEIYDLAQQADGKIVAAGVGGIIDFALARLNADGTLDDGFGDAGKTVVSVGQANNAARSVVLQADGRIVAAGYSRNNNEWDVGVARFDTAGRLDPSFSGDGRVISDLGTEWDMGGAVALAPDGDIIVAGQSGEPNVNNDFAVVRYQGDPPAVDFATLEGGVLRVTGTGDNDVLAITNSFEGELIASLNGLVERFPFGQVSRIEVNGGAGDDEFTLNLAVFRQTRFDGGAGTDRAVFNGAEGNDEIDIFASGVEGGGNDLSLGPDVEDLTVNGRFGFDTIRTVQPPVARLTVDGGEGNDTIDYQVARQGGTLRGGGGDDLILSYNLFSDVVNGGAGNDRASTDFNLDVGVDVETYLNSRINGAVYHDANGNGTFEFFETPLQGWRVYIDANNNGTRDGNELFVDTNNRLSPNYSFVPLAAGTYTVRVEPQPGWQATVPAGAVRTVTLAANRAMDFVDFGFRLPVAGRVEGRHVFYNNSFFDEDGVAPGEGEELAVAPDKEALLPGHTATFRNVTSYTRGINGLLVELAGAVVGALDSTDFEFRTSPDGSTWSNAPAPSSIVVRPSPVPEQPTQVYVYFADNAIRNAWLRVVVKNNTRTGLPLPEEFYFGNLVGDTGEGNTGAQARVNALDMAAVKRALGTNAEVENAADFNRDGRVNALDLAAARSGLNRSLPMISIPIPAAGAAPAPARDRDGVLDEGSDGPLL